jgi:hypothetical protein
MGPWRSALRQAQSDRFISDHAELVEARQDPSRIDSSLRSEKRGQATFLMVRGKVASPLTPRMRPARILSLTGDAGWGPPTA